MQVGGDRELELDNALTGFSVVASGDEHLGEVAGASLDRSCLIVAAKSRLPGRTRRYTVHRCAIEAIDLDTMTITTWASREQVKAAPEAGLLDSSGDHVERYYSRIAAPA